MSKDGYDIAAGDWETVRRDAALLGSLDFASLDEPPPALSDAYRPDAPEDDWLRRRTHAWGGSEAAPLLVAYGLGPLGVHLSGWVTEQAEHYQRLGIPKVLAWKSGLRPRKKRNRAMERGVELERRLYQRYKEVLAPRRFDPAKLRYSTSAPIEWFPLVDRHSRALAVTPDAWARNREGELGAIELKCTFRPMDAIPWYYRVQLEAEMAVMEARWGALVVGERWIDERTDVPPGPVRAFYVRPDPAMVQLIRLTCREAWHLAEELRDCADIVDGCAAKLEGYAGRSDKAAKAAVRELKGIRKEAAASAKAAWQRSYARLANHRKERDALNAVLDSIEGLDEITEGYAA